MVNDLVDVSSGDLITAQRQNDINMYIEHGTHAIITLSLNAGSGNIQTTGNFTDGTNAVTAAQMKDAYDERLIPHTDNKQGSDASGSDGDSNRVLALSSTPHAIGVIYIAGTPLHLTQDYTLSGANITFLNKVWDSQYIGCLFFTKGAL